MSSATLAPDPIDCVILARLIVPATATKTRDDVGKLAARGRLDAWPADFAARWGRLLAADLLRPKGRATSKTFELTDAGHRHARSFLGLEQPPAKLTWPAIQADYIVPLAMGLRPGSAGARQIKKAAALKLAVVARSRQLPLGESAKAKDLVARLAWKLIGVDSDAAFNAENVIQHLVFRQQPGKPLTTDRTMTMLASAAVGARTGSLPELRLSAIGQWLSKPEPAQPAIRASEPVFDLPAFAERALAAARHSTSGRFGDNKVFISHVYRGFDGDPIVADLPSFKLRLLDANREGLLRLSRADLVEAMDPGDLRDSATVCDNATFHFIRI